MTPPQEHMHLDGPVNAGIPPTIVCGAPGNQGPVVTGMHGIGVRTPRAAAVAAATVGLDGVVHIPNGGMFTIGAMSFVVATGLPSTSTRLVGITTSVDGAMPKLHMRFALMAAQGVPIRPHFLEPRTDSVRRAPVVVTRQTTSRSPPWSQLRADGSR